jgi:hypothetical protein
MGKAPLSLSFNHDRKPSAANVKRKSNTPKSLPSSSKPTKPSVTRRRAPPVQQGLVMTIDSDNDVEERSEDEKESSGGKLSSDSFFDDLAPIENDFKVDSNIPLSHRFRCLFSTLHFPISI